MAIHWVSGDRETFDRWLSCNYKKMVTEKQEEPHLPSLKATWHYFHRNMQMISLYIQLSLTGKSLNTVLATK